MSAGRGVRVPGPVPTARDLRVARRLRAIARRPVVQALRNELRSVDDAALLERLAGHTGDAVDDLRRHYAASLTPRAGGVWPIKRGRVMDAILVVEVPL